jgi:hypothetical protein
MKKTSILTICLGVAMASSCGKKNEVGTPLEPINGIGFQNTNLLASFDPSFENQSNGQTSVGSRPNRPGRPIAHVSGERHFRVTGGARRGSIDHEISQVAAKSGSKSLRLYMANDQTLVMPISTRRKESPLQVVSGARYRYQAFVRFPRSSRGAPRAGLEVFFKDGFNSSGKTRLSLNVGNRDSSGWFPLQGEFEVPSLTTNAKLYLQINGSNDLLLDDLSLIRIR